MSHNQNQFSANLVVNLKRQVHDLTVEIQNKDNEIEFLKRKMKNTKINELCLEVDVLSEHLGKLR